MKKKEHVFSTSLELGKKGEILGYELFYKNIVMEKVQYDINPKQEKSGIDFAEPRIKGFKVDTLEIKTRRYEVVKYWGKCPDFFLETESVVGQDKPGWLKTSKAKLLMYLVLNKEETDIVHAWIFDFQKLKKWFLRQDINRWSKKFSRTNYYGSSYRTEGRIVPLSDIPVDFFKRLISAQKEQQIGKLRDEFI